MNGIQTHSFSGDRHICTSSCKYNYHTNSDTIMTMTDPLYKFGVNLLNYFVSVLTRTFSTLIHIS